MLFGGSRAIERQVRRLSATPTIPRPSRRRWRRIWRSQVRPFWREVQPAVVLVLAVVVLVLGTIGYHALHLTGGKHYSFADSLYRAVTLFGFGGSVEPPVPWQLQIARILAPALTGFALVQGLLRLSREQLELLGIRLLTHGHVVVAGLGATGSPMAFALHEAGYRVVVIEPDAANSAIGGCIERGIPVLRGDASDRSLLRKARVAQARYLIATCGDDGRDVNVAMAAEQVARGRRGVLTAFVHLADLGLWRALKAEAVLASDRPEFRLEFFNAYATGARMLLERHSPFFDATGQKVPSPKPCVVGRSDVAENLVLYMAAQWRGERGADQRLPPTPVR